MQISHRDWQTNSTAYVFVYGTLMEGMSNRAFVRRFLLASHRAYIEGRLYHMKYGYPAVIEGQDRISGELLLVSSPEHVLSTLDSLEGYCEGRSDNLYDRRKISVETDQGELLKAWAYFWADSTQMDGAGIYIPEGNWRSYLAANRHLPRLS